MDFEKCKNEFNKYVSNFDMNINKINRKYYHTYRVVGYMEKLAHCENLSESDIYLAKVCGLLHDIARFRQATEFQTFNDFISFDHGNVACEILMEDDYISKYLSSDEDKRICLKAIKNHNKFALEDKLEEKEVFFTKLLRDCDKLDILDTQKNLVDDGKTEIILPVLEAFRNRKLYKINPEAKVPNIVSEIVVHMCFIFDLNFNESYKILQEKNILERKIKLLRENCDEKTVDEIENITNSYINSKI